MKRDPARRAVITGMGAISPIGNDVASYWANLVAGVSGAARITAYDPSNDEVQIAAEVKGFDPRDWIDFKAARRIEPIRPPRGGGGAAGDRRFRPDDHRCEPGRHRGGDEHGRGWSGIIADGEKTYLEKGGVARGHFTVPSSRRTWRLPGGDQTGLRGPVDHRRSRPARRACIAFVEAKRMFDLGEMDVVIVGGAEANIIPIAVAAMANMKALSTRNDEPEKACRPFDLTRDGFVYGEAAAAMVIETLEHAQRRGARTSSPRWPAAHLTADAYHITAPDPSGRWPGGRCDGAERAGLRAGTRGLRGGARDRDAAERRRGDEGDQRALGEHADHLAISSNKSMVGHKLGAAGAMSGLAAVLAIRDGVIPPTINYGTPDPDCDLDYVPNTARKMPVNVAIINGFGFGGQNAVAAFRRVD